MNSATARMRGTFGNLSRAVEAFCFCNIVQMCNAPLRIDFVADDTEPYPRYCCETQENPPWSPACQTKTPHGICSPTLGPEVSRLPDTCYVGVRTFLLYGVGPVARSSLNICLRYELMFSTIDDQEKLRTKPYDGGASAAQVLLVLVYCRGG